MLWTESMNQPVEITYIGLARAYFKIVPKLCMSAVEPTISKTRYIEWNYSNIRTSRYGSKEEMPSDRMNVPWKGHWLKYSKFYSIGLHLLKEKRRTMKNITYCFKLVTHDAC